MKFEDIDDADDKEERHETQSLFFCMPIYLLQCNVVLLDSH